MTLRSEQRRKQSDRTGACHEQPLRRPAGARADALRMLPRLRDDARRLDEDADQTKFRIERHDEVGIEPPKLRAVTVESFDAVLRVLVIAAHIPFADRAVL